MRQPRLRDLIRPCFWVAAVAAVATFSAGSGCSAPRSPGDTDGVVELALETQAGLASLKVRFEGSNRAVERCIALDGTPSTRLDGLPTGIVAVTASAYRAAACAGDAIWRSDPITVAIVAGRPTNLRLVLRPNGVAIVDTTFTPEAQMSVGPHTDPNDPAIATLQTDNLTVVAYGVRDGGGNPASLQMLKAQLASSGDVFVPVDPEGRMLGFVSESASASFHIISESRMSVHIEGPGFATDVEIDNPFAASPALGGPSASIAAPIASSLAFAPASGQTVDVHVDRCGLPENDAVVAVVTTSANGVIRTEIANRTGEGTYASFVNLPPPTLSPVDLSTVCTVLKYVADWTCKALKVAAPGAELVACSKIALETGPFAEIVEPICLGAFAAARTWCLMTGNESGRVTEFVCQKIEDGVNALIPKPVYPIAVSASARIPGAAALIRSTGVRVNSNTETIPDLWMSMNDGCSSEADGGAGADAGSASGGSGGSAGGGAPDGGGGMGGGGGIAGTGGIASGGTSGSGGVAGPCPSPQVRCNGGCVDPTCLGAAFDPSTCSCQNPSCNWGLDHLSQNFPGDGGQDQILIGVTFGLCGVGNPNTSSSWIHLGTPTLIPNVIPAQWAMPYTVDKNASTATRQGQIGIGNRLFTVSQAAGGATCIAPTRLCGGKCVDPTCPNQVFDDTTCTCKLATCTWGLDHVTKSFAKTGGSDVVRISVISTGASCGPPSAKTSTTWIHLGPVTVVPNISPTQWTMSYTVDSNSVAPRQGSITVENRTLQVSEDGVVPTQTITQTQPTMPDVTNSSSDVHPLDMSLALVGVNNYDLVLNNSALFAQGTVTVWDHRSGAVVGRTSCTTVGSDPVFLQSTPCEASSVISLDKARSYDWVLHVTNAINGGFMTTGAMATIVTK